MNVTKHMFLVLLITVFLLSACSAQEIQITPTSAPTQVIEPVFTQSTENLPQSELEVPRISIEETKVALDSGLAVMVDVRSPSAFEASHIAGAISVPLGEIERNLPELTLDKEQWIITYCT